MITLKNDFHNTETKVRLELGQTLTREQARRIRRRLCPDGCQCAQDALGQRSMEEVRELTLVGHEIDSDGTVEIVEYDII